MAIGNFQVFIYQNGKKLKNTKDAEMLFQSLGVTNDGTDKGLNITDVGGAFDFNAKQVTNIADGSASGHAASKGQLDTGLAAKIDTSAKGSANGVASLGADSKIPSAQIPALAITTVSVVADEPAQLALNNQEGDVVKRTDESKTYIHNGGSAGTMADYTEITADGEVTSVNGQTGAVSLDTDDISEGVSNLYYTQARFDSAFTAKDTDDLSEGASNFYYTEGRFDSSFSGKSTTDLSEGTNLYYTQARFDSAFSGKDTDDLSEGASNLYFTDQRAQDALDVEGSYTNNEGVQVTARQVMVQTPGSPSQMTLAQANDASLDEASVLFMVKDATIADQAAGQVYMPEKGTKVGGFSALTVGDPIYLDPATGGGYVQTTSGHGSGDHVISLGKVISSTEVLWNPVYEYQFA